MNLVDLFVYVPAALFCSRTSGIFPQFSF